MGRTSLLLFVLLGIGVLVKCATFEQNFENQEIIRNIDLRGQVEIQTTKFTARNIGDGKAKSYVLAIPPLERGLLSSVVTYSDIEAGNELATDEVQLKTDALEGTRYFQFDFAEAIEKDESVEFHTVVVITHGLKAFPAEIVQAESQHVVYAGDAYSYSLYRTVIQRTAAILASKKVEFFTKKKSRHEEDRIEYGPFSDIEAYESSPISIHYENNSPFGTMRTAVQEIEISQWGNVAVEEHYLLAHDGAKLKGGFSRYDYQQSEARPSSGFRRIMAQLHPAAKDIYYRDEIGNISTSNVRFEDGHTSLEIIPRYPLFGGWKVDFYMGYNIPASEVLFTKKSSSSTYVLNMTFGSPFLMLVTDDLEVRVIMPEGATNIKWSTGVHVDSEDTDVRVTYLDTTGRPVLILKKANVFGIPPKYFQVTYSFTKLSMLREPLLLITAFFAFFVVCMVYVRIDLSLSSSKKKRSQNRIINAFLDKGEQMLAAYKRSDIIKGDAALKSMRSKVPDIAKKSSSALGKSLDDVLSKIYQSKKNIGASQLAKYHAVAQRLTRF